MAGDDTKAFCRYCKTEIRAHHSDLQNHSKTEKHIRNAAPFSSCPVRTLFDSGITTVKIDRSVKLAELKMAAHIACHSSILTVDHLEELVGEIAQKDIKQHRTKSSALVIGPDMQHQLLKDIGVELYSLVIDESTDVGMQKQLERDGGDANSITEALLIFLQECKLSKTMHRARNRWMQYYARQEPFTSHKISRAQPQRRVCEMCVSLDSAVLLICNACVAEKFRIPDFAKLCVVFTQYSPPAKLQATL